MAIEVSGQDCIDIIVARLTEQDVRCYDSEILHQLRALTWQELAQIVNFGDVTQWHNERIDTSIIG